MPSTIKRGAKGWRYQFQWQGKTFSKAWFPTKAAAIAAREEHRKQVQVEPRAGQGLTFRELANEYLDHSQRRHAPKTYQYKVIVFRKFKEWAGEDLPADQVTVQLLEAFLRTRPGNISYNRYRKDLCALRPGPGNAAL